MDVFAHDVEVVDVRVVQIKGQVEPTASIRILDGQGNGINLLSNMDNIIAIKNTLDRLVPKAVGDYFESIKEVDIDGEDKSI